MHGKELQIVNQVHKIVKHHIQMIIAQLLYTDDNSIITLIPHSISNFASLLNLAQFYHNNYYNYAIS